MHLSIYSDKDNLTVLGCLIYYPRDSGVVTRSKWRSTVLVLFRILIRTYESVILSQKSPLWEEGSYPCTIGLRMERRKMHRKIMYIWGCSFKRSDGLWGWLQTARDREESASASGSCHASMVFSTTLFRLDHPPHSASFAVIIYALQWLFMLFMLQGRDSMFIEKWNVRSFIPNQNSM